MDRLVRTKIVVERVGVRSKRGVERIEFWLRQWISPRTDLYVRTARLGSLQTQPIANR